jgi:hypothetical protein
MILSTEPVILSITLHPVTNYIINRSGRRTPSELIYILTAFIRILLAVARQKRLEYSEEARS